MCSLLPETEDGTCLAGCFVHNNIRSILVANFPETDARQLYDQLFRALCPLPVFVLSVRKELIFDIEQPRHIVTE